MFNMFTQAETKEERAKQLAGIANLHISVAKEIMASDKPLSMEEMDGLLDILITANEAKHLAHQLKTEVEKKESA